MDIKQLSMVFGSYSKAQEILFLLHGAKDVVRQGFYEAELPAIEQFCQEYQLHLVKSKFKVLLADEENFSNKGIRIPEDDSRPGMFFMYFSSDEEKALLASYYELMGNDKNLGLILGYPACCVNFFLRHFNENKTNLELKPTNPWTNLSKRDQDIVLLSHFPCNSECKESIDLGKKYYNTLLSINPENANRIFQELEPK